MSSPLRKKLIDTLQYALVILILLSPLFFYLSLTHYIDPFRFKMIKIQEDIIRGNKKTIRQAISHLRKTDKNSYQMMLRYVDRIGEKHCIVADHKTHHEEFLEGLELPGCYVRGSKTIYLLPSKDQSTQTIKERAETIARMSELSRDYWGPH